MMRLTGMLALLLTLLALLGLGTSTTTEPPTPPVTVSCEASCPPALDRIALTWSGGFTGQPEQTVTVTDPARLAELATLLPERLPEAPTGPTYCADCYAYHLEITPAGDAPHVYDVDDSNLPEGLQALVRALREG